METGCERCPRCHRSKGQVNDFISFLMENSAGPALSCARDFTTTLPAMRDVALADCAKARDRWQTAEIACLRAANAALEKAIKSYARGRETDAGV